MVITMIKISKIKIYLMILLFIVICNNRIYGNPWTIGRNEIYARGSLFSIQSHHRFNLDSQKKIFNNDGFTKVYGALFDISYGVTDRLNINAIVPVIGYDFRDSFNKLAGTGLGDVKTVIKYKFYDKKIASSIELGIKFPSSDNTGNAADVRIGEEQYDFDASTSIGYKPSKFFIFLSLDLGYRFKRKNTDEISKPGDEFFFRFDSGILLRKDLLLATGIGGFSGRRIEQFGLKFDNTERRIFSFSMNLIKGITPRTGLMFNLNIPFAGKNYSAGSLFGIGFFFYKGKYININQKINIPSVTCQSICQI